MQLNFTALWDALGWAILHSLWQGALIGLVVYGLRVLATERRARLRYLSGMFGLVATFAAFIATFVVMSLDRIGDAVSIAATTKGPTLAAQEGGASLVAPSPVEAAPAPLDVSVSLLPDTIFDTGLLIALVPWLGMIWAIGFAFLGLQAFRAWSHTRFLATEGLRTPGHDWTARFAALVDRSRTNQRIRLFVSEHVSGPMTLGALKPIVLVPVGFLTALPPAQVEAILLHELAHIRRHDFLFGLIQTAIRTVLYFNPAVLMLSRCVDTDREQACDDIAVSINGQPVDLVRGLAALRLGTHKSTAPELAMAADGGPLLTRLNRLMGKPSVRTSTPNRLSAVAVSTLMLGTAAYSSVSVAHPHPTPPEAPTIILPDTIIRDGSKVTYFRDGEMVAPMVVPPMPVMPEMPALPAMPPVPVMEVPVAPPPPIFGNYSSSDDFESAMEDWGQRMETWGETMESWGEAFSESFDEDYEARMEAWSEEVEARFDEEYEAKMEAWSEEMEAWGESIEAMTQHIDDLSVEDLKAMGINVEDIEAAGAAFGLSVADGVVELVLPKQLAEEARKEIQEERERMLKQAERNRAQVERDRAQAERNRAQAERNKAQARRDKAQAERDRAQALRDKAQAERNRAQVERDRQQAEIAKRNVERQAELQAKSFERAEEKRLRSEERRLREIAREARKAKGDPKSWQKAEARPLDQSPKISVSGNDFRTEDIREMVQKALWADGLVKTGDQKFRVELSDYNHMEIDGKLQSPEVSKRYRDLLTRAGVDQNAQIDLKANGKNTSMSLKTENSKTEISITQ